MYLCRADGVSSVSVLLSRSGFPIIRLQNYFGNITSCLNRYYISVTTAFFYILFFTVRSSVCPLIFGRGINT